MPTSPSRWLTRPNLSPKRSLKMRATATGATHVGQQHAHPPEGAGPQAAVERRGDEQRDDDLRHAREQEDADRVLQRVPEVGLAEHVGVVLQADEVALAADQAPLVQRDPRRVEQREESDDAEEDEERRDVGVGRGLLVGAGEASAPGRPGGQRRPRDGGCGLRAASGAGGTGRSRSDPLVGRVARCLVGGHRAIRWSALSGIPLAGAGGRSDGARDVSGPVRARALGSAEGLDVVDPLVPRLLRASCPARRGSAPAASRR